LVVDPNQQELLYEDADFASTYRDLLAGFRRRQLPYALLCTHGDTLNDKKRKRLERLPSLLQMRGEFESLDVFHKLPESDDGDGLRRVTPTGGVGCEAATRSGNDLAGSDRDSANTAQKQ
jgi:hypothetical protein